MRRVVADNDADSTERLGVPHFGGERASTSLRQGDEASLGRRPLLLTASTVVVMPRIIFCFPVLVFLGTALVG
jgi:hypothetical protein